MAHQEWVYALQTRLRRLTLPVVLLAALAVSAAPAGAAKKPVTVKVMSRNVYLGADLTPGVRA
ncbi:MAG: hypothetical protein QOG86_495, partial [Thermoleophilaceae bacterium]|nr:hypothetical protein [Thermoleophilaceae bacterium]